MSIAPLDLTHMDPASFASCLIAGDDPSLTLSANEARLLDPGHPFTRAGRWQGIVVSRGGRPRARLVASVDPRQRVSGRPAGAIGCIAATEPAALRVALAAGEAWLAGQGAVRSRCPVNLSIWFGHRAVTDGFPSQGGAPPFVLEPANPPELAGILAEAGYYPAHRSVSHLIDHQRAIAGANLGLRRMRAGGFRQRPIDLARLPAELANLHRLASVIFAGNWGYSEISLAEFIAYFGPLTALVSPEFVRFVEDEAGRAVGFILAVPASLGQPPGTPGAYNAIIVKTIGVLPEARRRHAGLGSALIATVHDLARRQGYAYGIHALMAENSYAQRVSAGWGSWLRSYATFERDLSTGPIT